MFWAPPMHGPCRREKCGTPAGVPLPAGRRRNDARGAAVPAFLGRAIVLSHSLAPMRVGAAEQQEATRTRAARRRRSTQARLQVGSGKRGGNGGISAIPEVWGVRAPPAQSKTKDFYVVKRVPFRRQSWAQARQSSTGDHHTPHTIPDHTDHPALILNHGQTTRHDI